MNKVKMFCLSLEPSHLKLIQDLSYIPVGLGNKLFNENWLTDKSGDSISEKNQFYGEYTFHYWIWKNYLKNLKKEWVGFCQYRKFWSLSDLEKAPENFEQFKEYPIREIPKEYSSYESIIGVPLFVNKLRLSKFIKNNFFTMVSKPYLFFNNKKRNIKFHFDMMHGHGNLSKAIDLLDDKEKEGFKFFVENSVSFNPHNMFICKSTEILNTYYQSVFPWLKKCENLFGFDLKGYGSQRMYGFLAERYMSYWFQKYTNYKIMPIIFKDLTDFKKD